MNFFQNDENNEYGVFCDLDIESNINHNSEPQYMDEFGNQKHHFPNNASENEEPESEEKDNYLEKYNIFAFMSFSSLLIFVCLFTI